MSREMHLLRATEEQLREGSGKRIAAASLLVVACATAVLLTSFGGAEDRAPMEASAKPAMHASAPPIAE
jgi:hypothetical protein